MNDSESHHLQTKFVATCAILALIGISVALAFRSGQSSEAFPVRFAPDLEWVDIYLRSDMLAALSKTSQVDRHSLETLLCRTPRLTEAWNKLQVANKHWEGRRQRAAKTAWEGIAHAYPKTDAAYAALSNLADALRAQHQMPDAVNSVFFQQRHNAEVSGPLGIIPRNATQAKRPENSLALSLRPWSGQ